MARLETAAHLIGRDVQRKQIIQRLLTQSPHMHMPVVICGMTGIGKSALAAAVAQDQQIQAHFNDGIFSVSLGQHPDINSVLSKWAAQCQIQPTALSTELLSLQLNARLSQARALFILDDVWDVLHVTPLLLGGYDCRLLVTTRLYSIAHFLAVRESDIIRLPLLLHEHCLQILHPFTFNQFEVVEGLPLLLQALRTVLEENSQSTTSVQAQAWLHLILEVKPPLGYALPANEALHNIAALYRRTVARMPDHTLPYLQQLGQSPGLTHRFHLELLQALWRVADAKPLVREFVDQSVLEPLGGGWFYISTLIKAYLNRYL